MTKLSIAISCFKPSHKSIININNIYNVLKNNTSIELSYFLNGKCNNEHEKQLINFFHNNKQENFFLNYEDENIGVGMGVWSAINFSNGEHIFLLGDDDIIQKECIEYILDKILKNDFDIGHQYLIDKSYSDSLELEKILNKSDRNYQYLLAEVGFRSGALPGFIFKKCLFEDATSWKDKLYPWIELVFHPKVNSIALLSPKVKIEVDNGPDIKDRFTDRVPRGSDYGFLERISYSKLSKSKTVIYAYNSFCYLWIIKLSKMIFNFSMEKYKSLMHSINIKCSISQYFGNIIEGKLYIFVVLLENPNIFRQVLRTYFLRRL